MSRLLTLLLEAGRGAWPRWSPDGRRLAFFSRRETGGEDDEIYTWTPSTGRVLRLTDRQGHDFCPSWSPDSKRLVFVSVRPDGTRSLAIAAAESGASHGELAGGYFRVTEPVWSPDGHRIAYAARTDAASGYDLYVAALR